VVFIVTSPFVAEALGCGTDLKIVRAIADLAVTENIVVHTLNYPTKDFDLLSGSQQIA
jgi:hypothetical protein